MFDEGKGEIEIIKVRNEKASLPTLLKLKVDYNQSMTVY